jgi:hypothetical protein
MLIFRLSNMCHTIECGEWPANALSARTSALLLPAETDNHSDVTGGHK